jgi:hypothetical protein
VLLSGDLEGLNEQAPVGVDVDVRNLTFDSYAVGETKKMRAIEEI